MSRPPLHDWNLSPAEAQRLQEQLAARVDVSSPPPKPRLLGGADISYDRGDDRLYAAVVVLEAATLEVVEQADSVGRATYPYVPGLLSFREAPALIAAFERLKREPDVLICDGQGIAHPRRLGIASHLGLWLDLPTIGCAKSKLCGTYEEPGPNRGDRAPLFHKGELIGTVLRTRTNVRPVFVSPGHRCDLAGAERIVLEALGRYRLPIPTRAAHQAVNRLRVEAKSAEP